MSQCQDCGKELPSGSAPRTKYCSACSRERDNARRRTTEYKKARMKRQRSPEWRAKTNTPERKAYISEYEKNPDRRRHRAMLKRIRRLTRPEVQASEERQYRKRLEKKREQDQAEFLFTLRAVAPVYTKSRGSVFKQN